MDDRDAAQSGPPRPLWQTRRPTMGDVAREAGVSRPLVSIIMRGALGASEDTRSRVLRIAEEMGYVPDERARKLRQHSSHLIGISFELHQPFYGDLVEQIYLAAGAQGYDVALSAITPTRDETTAIESLIRERCDAVFVLGLGADAEDLRHVADRLPVVSVARRIKAPFLGIVRADDRAGLRLAVEHLVTLGHERIAHIDGAVNPGSADRRSGYRSTMKKLGLTENVRVVRGGFREDDGARAMRELLDDDVPPTAVIAFNDRCATGAIDLAASRGLRVPEDLSVIGYDDSRIALIQAHQLTSVSQDPATLARAAVALAVEQLNGQRPREIVVQPHLLVRDTTQVPSRLRP